jgi:hypothetical protein
VFINGEFIGIEFYANSEVWATMSNDILKAFTVEALRFKNKAQHKVPEFQEEFIKILGSLKLKFSSRQGVALGTVVDINSDNNKWRGITLVHDKSLVQFYVVSKRGGYQENPHSNIQFQTVINQRYEI